MVGGCPRALSLTVMVALVPGLVGCGGAKTKTVTSVRTAEPAPTPPMASTPTAPAPRLGDYTATLYDAKAPRDWTQEEDDKRVSRLRESKWRDPGDPLSSLTIDARAESTSPADKAAMVRADTSRAGDYREIAFGTAVLNGHDAYQWTFEVSGTRRTDYFLNQCGIGIAVLGSTSPTRFADLKATFQRIAKSVKPNCPPPPSHSRPAQTTTSTNSPTSCSAEPDVTDPNDCPPEDPSNPPADFCETHHCIPSFDEGTGSTVQCNDGEWSQSGGRQGACSSHGGESDNPPGPPPSY